MNRRLVVAVNSEQHHPLVLYRMNEFFRLNQFLTNGRIQTARFNLGKRVSLIGVELASIKDSGS